jgi:hypothetical protein
MTDNVENLILGTLRAMWASIDRMGESLNDLKARVGQIGEQLAGIRRDMSMLHAVSSTLTNGWTGWKIGWNGWRNAWNWSDKLG